MTWNSPSYWKTHDKLYPGGSAKSDTWKEIRDRVKRRDGSRCVVCRSQRLLHVDHIVPLSKGGSNRLSNLQTLCKACHEKKTGRKLYDWRESSSPPEKHRLRQRRPTNGENSSVFTERVLDPFQPPESLRAYHIAKFRKHLPDQVKEDIRKMILSKGKSGRRWFVICYGMHWITKSFISSPDVDSIISLCKSGEIDNTDIFWCEDGFDLFAFGWVRHLKENSGSFEICGVSLSNQYQLSVCPHAFPRMRTLSREGTTESCCASNSHSLRKSDADDRAEAWLIQTLSKAATLVHQNSTATHCVALSGSLFCFVLSFGLFDWLFGIVGSVLAGALGSAFLYRFLRVIR